MASVFTFDPDPPRVSSPWLMPKDEHDASERSSPVVTPLPSTKSAMLADYGVTKLQAEPQEGPTEYKLHLLLRPRRTYHFMSTATGKNRSKLKELKSASALAVPQPQTRQQRLQHLTTQLLWRLQQSSPYHSSSSKELSIPKLPDDSVDLGTLVQPGTLVPGLEESRGALYEIGVSDDGTLVGLTKDEMDESITTLRVMAASLGCSVEVVRMVIVGDCTWTEAAERPDKQGRTNTAAKKDKLWVAEALVSPSLAGKPKPRSTGAFHLDGSDTPGDHPESSDQVAAMPSRGSSTTPQLRVTLTGPTTSGKSSLLGTLSTGTLDNGRGKSRLSLLRHRHELVSGVTSSIAQELIGYKDLRIHNFSHGNIESWADIHDCSEGGKLVFVTDSGGHPRYRRTVLRGLLNWSPHWSILCIAADDADALGKVYGATSSAQDVLGSAAASVDLVNAHLTLSLKLEVPMAIVITKLDLASKASLKQTMAKILTSIKSAGRTPKILQPDQIQHDDLSVVPAEDASKVQGVIDLMAETHSVTQYVPIVLTSCVNGTGVGLVHALLEALPVPPRPLPSDLIGHALNPEQPKCLFHIDDTFSLGPAYDALAKSLEQAVDQGIVVSGYMRFGDLSVGDQILVGPFPADEDDTQNQAPKDRPAAGGYGLSISHPSSSELARIAMKNAVSASAVAGEWHTAHIVSVRNLRLPVRTLEAGQAGSVGLVWKASERAAIPRVRRGMVLAVPSKHMTASGLSLQAASGFTAVFRDPAVKEVPFGTFVNVYIASVRAAARVLSLRDCGEQSMKFDEVNDEEDAIFSISNATEDSNGRGPEMKSSKGVEVFLELLHSREWVELGSKVVLLEGGSQDRSGLEGFVGHIIEIVD